MWANDEVAGEPETETELHVILIPARSFKAKVVIGEVDRTDNALVHDTNNNFQQRKTKNTDEDLFKLEK
jgi:hypothetical protein